jgi:hypothetical protein
VDQAQAKGQEEARAKRFAAMDEPDRLLAASWGYNGQPWKGGTGQGAQSGGNACAALGGGYGLVLRTMHASQLNGKTTVAAAVVQNAPRPIA